MNHRLSKSQLKLAERLADENESVSHLTQVCTDPKELDVLVWTDYLIKSERSRKAGVVIPGYTGRQSNR